MKFQSPLSPPRADNGTLLPAALLALLVASAVLQLMLVRDDSLPDEGVGRVMPGSTEATVSHRDAPSVILTRPLFSPSRSMEARPIATGGVDAGPLEGAVPVGTIARGRAAQLFLRLPDGTVRAIGLNGSYLGWRLAGLSATGATFVRGAERMTIAYGSAATALAQTGGDEDEDTDEE